MNEHKIIRYYKNICKENERLKIENAAWNYIF